MKNIEGIYKVELLGPYGWENYATAFLQGGQFRSASAGHFTAGTYAVGDESFRMEGNLTQHTEKRTLFGRRDVKGLPIRFRGKIQGGIIDGEARPADDDRKSVRFRLARLPVLN